MSKVMYAPKCRAGVLGVSCTVPIGLLEPTVLLVLHFCVGESRSERFVERGPRFEEIFQPKLARILWRADIGIRVERGRSDIGGNLQGSLRARRAGLRVTGLGLVTTKGTTPRVTVLATGTVKWGLWMIGTSPLAVGRLLHRVPSTVLLTHVASEVAVGDLLTAIRTGLEAGSPVSASVFIS